MTFAVSGGIEWEKDTTNKVLTIKPASSPESGYASGQMKDYTYGTSPWGTIYTSGFELIIKEGVTKIGDYAFNGSWGFTGTLTIPSGVTSIGKFSFSGCKFTGTLTIPSGVTNIKQRAFQFCTSFNALVMPDSITSIEESAFDGCSGFTGSLTIPKNLTSLDKYVFQNCSGFTGTLTIPAGVISIGEETFDGCSGFTGTLTIPSSVTAIGVGAFLKCSGLSSILFKGNQPTLSNESFNLNNSSPEKTYDVYSNGWATSTTFPEYTYTKWNYISTGSPMYGKVNAIWVKGKPFVKVGGHYKKVVDSFSKVGGHWKKSI